MKSNDLLAVSKCRNIYGKPRRMADNINRIDKSEQRDVWEAIIRNKTGYLGMYSLSVGFARISRFPRRKLF